MGMVQFTALRSLMPGRVEGELVSLEIGFQDAIRSREVSKEARRSLSGQTESVYLGADTFWNLEFEPVSGSDLARLQEFLDSTAPGGDFKAWVYGEDAAPITVQRADRGYSPRRFIDTAQRSTEPYSARITVIEQ